MQVPLSHFCCILQVLLSNHLLLSLALLTISNDKMNIRGDYGYMKNLKLLIPVVLSSALLTGCTVPNMPWDKKEAEPTQSVFDDYQSEEQLNRPSEEQQSQPMEDTSPIEEGTQVNQESEVEGDLSSVDFGNVTELGNMIPDLSISPQFLENFNPKELILDGITIKQNFTSVVPGDTDSFTSYKLDSGTILRITQSTEQVSLDELADRIISAPYNTTFQCSKSSVTLCGQEAKLIVANSTSVADSSIILLFSNQGVTWVLQVQYMSDVDGMSIASPIFNSISLTSNSVEFGADSKSQIQDNTSSMPYTIQLKENKSYLEFADLSFKEPEGALRDDTFCAKGSDSPKVTNKVLYTFSESKNTLAYTTQDITSLSVEQFEDTLVEEIRTKTDNPAILLVKAITLPSEPYMLNYREEKDNIQQYIYVKGSTVHIFTFRAIEGNDSDIKEILNTLETVNVKD